MTEINNTTTTTNIITNITNKTQIKQTCITYYDNIKSYIIIFYNYIKQLLIIDKYTINDDDEFIIQIKYFILRYRRIIGIILLCLLLYIDNKCNTDNSNKYNNDNGNSNSNSNGNKNMIGGSAPPRPPPHPPTRPLPPLPPTLTRAQTKIKANLLAKDKRAQDTTKAQELIDFDKKQQSDAKAAADKITTDAKAASDKDTADTAAAKTAEAVKKEKGTFGFGKKGAILKADASKKLGDIGSKVSSKLSIDKDAFKAKTGKDYTGLGLASSKLKSGIYNSTAWAGNKFKDMSGWLYQFLFAIALTISICAIILPSVSFLIIGIICYFLLRKRMIQLKSM